MTIKQIKYAIAIAETGSMSKAASRFGVKQPSISTAIAELEYELDTKLFERTARGMTVTKGGRQFLSETLRLCQSIEQMENRYRVAVLK